MKLMIDTNIFLDVLLERQPFFQASQTVLFLCEEKKVEGFLTASTVTDIFYLVRRHTHDIDIAYKSLGCILNIIKILPVTNEDIFVAYSKKAHDFEDCLLAVCAKKNNCSYIVTRNKKDFLDFDIPLLSPKELIDKLK